MNRVQVSMVVVSLALVGCGSLETAPVTKDTQVEDVTAVLKIENQEMLNAINLARSQSRDCNNGLGVVGPSSPLVWNDDLYQSAYEHATDMANSDTFSHYGSGTKYDITASNSGSGRSYFYERITSNGYGSYSALGENIAGGQSSIEDVMRAWLSSPGHYSNIMNDDFAEVGVSVVVEEDSTYGIYWVQNFGKK